MYFCTQSHYQWRAGEMSFTTTKLTPWEAWTRIIISTWDNDVYTYIRLTLAEALGLPVGDRAPRIT